MRFGHNRRWLSVSSSASSSPSGSGDSSKDKGGAKLLSDHDDFAHAKTVKLSWASKTVWRNLRKSEAQLHITISGSLQHSPAQRQLLLFNRQQGDSTLPGLIGQLLRAGVDPLIRTVFITVKPLSCKFGRIEELLTAIRKVSGEKRVVAYLEAGSEKEIAVAAACTEAYCPPGAYVSLSGFSSTYSLLSGLADKVGVAPEVFQRGRYKGGHALTASWRDGEGLPEEVKRRTGELRESTRQQYVESLSKSLDRPVEEVSELLKAAPKDGPALVEAGIITGILYKDQVFNEILNLNEEKPDTRKKKPVLIDGQSYSKVALSELGLAPKVSPVISRMVSNRLVKRFPTIFQSSSRTPGIAVIPVVGMIQDGKGRRNSVGSETMIDAIERVAKREDVDAVVLRIDSPGGSALASDGIWRAVSLLGKRKVVIASLGDVAASGGYYIAMGCTKIYANPGTITGSIGVITLRLSFQKLLQRLQIWTTTDSGVDPYSAASSAVHRSLNPLERDRVDTVVESLYRDFVQKAADCRNMTINEMEERAEGRVFTGAEAIANGLADERGGLLEAIQAASEAIGARSWHECHVTSLNVGNRGLLARLGLPTSSGSPSLTPLFDLPLTALNGSHIVGDAADAVNTLDPSVASAAVAMSMDSSDTEWLQQTVDLLQSREPLAVFPEALGALDTFGIRD